MLTRVEECTPSLQGEIFRHQERLWRAGQDTPRFRPKRFSHLAYDGGFEGLVEQQSSTDQAPARTFMGGIAIDKSYSGNLRPDLLGEQDVDAGDGNCRL